MTPIRNTTDWIQVNPNKKDRMAQTRPVVTEATVMMLMNSSISFDIGVCLFSKPEANPAILPITVLSPVATTIPWQTPMESENKTRSID